MFYNPANGLRNGTGAPAQLPQNVLAPIAKHLSRPVAAATVAGKFGGTPGQQVASATLPQSLSQPPSGHLAEVLRRLGF